MLSNSEPAASTKVNVLINPLKPKLLQVIFEHTVHTAKKTPYFICRAQSINVIRKITAVCCDN